MHQNSRRLLQLINQLLDVSKLDAGSYAINTNRRDIIPFLNKIVYSFSSLAERKKIRLEIEIGPELKTALQNRAIHFYFDGDVIEKILYNLLGNAFKFTPPGGKITAGLSLAQGKPSYVELSVKDTGSGIPEEKAPFVFDRFYQADTSAKRQYDGSGIGLALVKELVELHFGEIRLESRTGGGAEFKCVLPLDKKAFSANNQKTEGNAPLLVEGTGTNSEQHAFAEPDSKHSVVLVVEDHDDVRKYVREKLSDNYQVLEAKNGNEGLELAREKIPDLIVSDVMMPGMDGLELCKLLKDDDRTSHVPVILLTARAEDADKIEGLETGADAYLIKPFNARELLAQHKKPDYTAR